ncbi:MAG: 4-alpha-glucanotransferase [Acidobacteria bacterium]|nr:MAG: 4-alpha-glucanotransferase [Acidobacteriota bacterium]
MMQLRRAGISVPLFSLRSTRSWGIGEIGDIPLMAGWLREACQSVLQILPLNELAPSESSPYSALSAMAIDPQFISIWMMDDGEVFEDAWKREIDAVRCAPAIDYNAVRRLKSEALKACFDRFFETEWVGETDGAAMLRSYVAAESWWLDEYSLYRALRAQAGERPWIEWPAEFRDRDPAALARARVDLSRDILFYQYVQWVAAEQWQAVRMGTEGVEILGDFPFTVTLDSADVWSRRDEFLLDASVGTPPDAFSETGQEWGLPPYNWDKARANNFEWLRMRARRQAALYDGFRLDHLVGFYRTYVRPLDGRPAYFMPGEEPAQTALGEAVMRIMMATSADVSVEDLGTVPDFVRASIARLGLPGYKVLRWEPLDPALFPPLSVAMTGTHDTETVAVWWESLTAVERRRFGSDAPKFDAAVRDIILNRMYAAGSNLVLLPIQDIFGWRDRINHPATVSETNWTYVLPWPVDRFGRQPEAVERANRLAAWSQETGRWHPSVETDD